MSTPEFTAVLTTIGTIVGGLIAAGVSLLPQRARRRDRQQAAIRFVRDDFYAGQAKIAWLILKGAWWRDDLQLASLAATEDYGALATRLNGDDWSEISGARRHLKRIEENRGGEIPLKAQLWKDYKLLEYSRRTLARYDRNMPYKLHSDFETIDKLMSNDPDVRR